MSTNTDIWISGAFAVVVVDFLVYPFDTLKTRIQSPNYTKIYKNPQTGAVNRSLLFRGLYQGVGSVVLATIPASGAFFTTYEALKHTLHNLPSQSQSIPQLQLQLPTPIIHSLSSCTAEAISCFIITPAEVLKQNAQVVTTTPTNPTSNPQGKGKGKGGKVGSGALLQTMARFRSQPYKLWSGYTALLGRNLPFTGLNWPVFEYLRSCFSGVVVERRRKKENKKGTTDLNGGGSLGGVEHALITGVSAAMAGTVSSVVTTPVDVVKTRMMLGASSTGSADSASGDGKGSRNAWGMGKKVVREEGVRGLFKGGAIRSLWTAVSFGIYLCMYEGGRGFLERRREGESD
ncbi:mitochondrial carrier [Aspergillus sclerotioniger CBS 115572]|uniref:Mitochondrial carrier n=1 Tax=Aspergillus sclerotioniger CBS 115572 TaxID=1450535 RepID=A0A317WG93_9EURO|nr:mitochondrial carrier [Aspergillus sclerotioniger CBS 115572]PWY83200.1 mitochondrial carrier [Aspergillus sclerotioniger CBS 115572]